MNDEVMMEIVFYPNTFKEVIENAGSLQSFREGLITSQRLSCLFLLEVTRDI